MASNGLSDIERELVASVSRERLMEDTRAIAQWVRLSGSRDERKAFDHIAGRLREMGLEPVLHEGWGYISLPEHAELRAEERELRAITHSMATSTPPEGLHLPLLYVGGGRADDYAGLDAHGKAVLLDGMAMPERVLTAERAGAAACVFANSDEHVHEMIVSGVWGSPTPATSDLLPHIPVVSIGAVDGGALRQMLRDRGPVEVRVVTQVRTEWTLIPTLTAQVDGAQEPDRFVLFSGHVDSWHYGAMDNGSANATMLETLRVLLSHRERFQRGLRVAFWSGHSHGRYAGSTWYGDHYWEELHERCVAHVNIDSTGGQGATVLTEAPAMAETRGVAADVIRALTGVEYPGTRFGRAGDQSFQGLGIPSLFMSLSYQPPAEGDAASGFAELMGSRKPSSGGLGWWWHTPDDTVDKLDPDLVLRDAQIYSAVLWRFVSQTILPLDVSASAGNLRDHLRDWVERAGKRFDLGLVLARAEDVAELASRFQARASTRDTALTADGARQVNDAMMAGERILVQLNYTRGDPFEPDPALSEPPVPMLAPLAQLVAAPEGSDVAHELETLLVRQRNRLLHGLTQAREALRRGLSQLGERT